MKTEQYDILKNITAVLIEKVELITKIENGNAKQAELISLTQQQKADIKALFFSINELIYDSYPYLGTEPSLQEILQFKQKLTSYLWSPKKYIEDENDLIEELKIIDAYKRVVNYEAFHKSLTEAQEKITGFFGKSGDELTGYNKLLKYYVPQMEKFISTKYGEAGPEQKLIKEFKEYLQDIVDLIEKLNDPKVYVEADLQDNPFKEIILSQRLIAENGLEKKFGSFYKMATKLELILGKEALYNTVNGIFKDEKDGNYFQSQCIKSVQWLLKFPGLIEGVFKGEAYLEGLPEAHQYRKDFGQVKSKKFFEELCATMNEYQDKITLQDLVDRKVENPSFLKELTYGDLLKVVTPKNGGTPHLLIKIDGHERMVSQLSSDIIITDNVMQEITQNYADLIINPDAIKLALPYKFSPYLAKKIIELPLVDVLKINSAYEAFLKENSSKDVVIKLMTEALENIIGKKLKADEKKEFRNELSKLKDELKEDLDSKLSAYKNTQQTAAISKLPVMVMLTEMNAVFTAVKYKDEKVIHQLNKSYLSTVKGEVSGDEFFSELSEIAGSIDSYKEKILETINKAKIQHRPSVSSLVTDKPRSISHQDFVKYDAVCDKAFQKLANLMEKHTGKPEAMVKIAQILLEARLEKPAQEFRTSADKITAGVRDKIIKKDIEHLVDYFSTVKEQESKITPSLISDLDIANTKNRNNILDKKERLTALGNIKNPIAFTVFYNLETTKHPDEVQKLAKLIQNRLELGSSAEPTAGLEAAIKEVFPQIDRVSINALQLEVQRQDSIKNIVTSADQRVAKTTEVVAAAIAANTTIALSKEQANAVVKILDSLAEHKIKFRQFNDNLTAILGKPIDSLDKNVKTDLIDAYQQDIKIRLEQDETYQAILSDKNNNKINVINDRLANLNSQLNDLNMKFNKQHTILRSIKHIFSNSTKPDSKITTGNIDAICDSFKEVGQYKETITLLYRCDKGDKYLDKRDNHNPIFERHWLGDIKNLECATVKLEANCFSEVKHLVHDLEQQIIKLQKQQEDAIKHAMKDKKGKHKEQDAKVIQACKSDLDKIKDTEIVHLITQLAKLANAPGLASAEFKESMATIRPKLLQLNNSIQEHYINMETKYPMIKEKLGINLSGREELLTSNEVVDFLNQQERKGLEGIVKASQEVAAPNNALDTPSLTKFGR